MTTQDTTVLIEPPAQPEDPLRALLSDGERERGVRRIFELSPARQAEVKAALKVRA